MDETVQKFVRADPARHDGDRTRWEATSLKTRKVLVSLAFPPAPSTAFRAPRAP